MVSKNIEDLVYTGNEDATRKAWLAQNDVDRWAGQDTIAHETISSMLAGREKTYGKFSKHAGIAQSLKATMHSTPTWNALSSDKKEALEMIQHKISRILNGNPNYEDSWVDISGYAQLIVDELKKNNEQS